MAVAEKWKGHKKLPPDALEKLERSQALWRENKDILLVYIFGSSAEGKTANDIDLAILFNKKPSYENISCLAERLYKLAGTRRIDIVDLNRAGPVFKFDIISRGRLLSMKDVDTLNNFELKVIKEHMDTEYLRKVQRWFLKEKALKSV